jgi:hypothetical protein
MGPGDVVWGKHVDVTTAEFAAWSHVEKKLRVLRHPLSSDSNRRRGRFVLMVVGMVEVGAGIAMKKKARWQWHFFLVSLRS